MASALQKLLSKLPTTRIVTSFQFHKSHAASFLEPLPFHRSPLVEINPECHQPTNLTSEHFNLSRSTMIYPTFPFGFPLNPLSSNGCCSHEAEDAELGNSRTMWADSVKKKRKKKMNKHKYQKLRKRMRRQT